MARGERKKKKRKISVMHGVLMNSFHGEGKKGLLAKGGHSMQTSEGKRIL